MRLAGILILAAVAALTARGEDTPNPAEIHIESLRYNGTGCRPGSVARMLSPDAKAFTLLFDDFMVDGTARGQAGIPHKNCRLEVGIRKPAGWKFAIFYMDYRGYVRLERKAEGTQRTLYQFGPRQVEVGRFNLKGPVDQDFFNRTVAPGNMLEFSSCEAGVKTLRINTSLHVKGEGFMTVDSADGEISHRYGIAWRRCEGSQPGPNRPGPRRP